MKTKPKMSYWIFRYYSGRGTDYRICVKLPAGTKSADVLEAAKDWAERETAGTACHEYTVNVRRVRKMPTRKVWLEKWDRLCKAKNKAVEEWNDWQVLSNPLAWSL